MPQAASFSRVHVNGVCGKGMAPAAALGILAGLRVTGDDITANHRREILEAAGIPIEIGRNSDGPSDTEVLVGTGSMPIAGKEGLRRRMSRLEFVNSVFELRRAKQICVSGSFGKSTACSLIGSSLAEYGSSGYIGADLPDTLCGARLGNGTTAVVEACEYRDAYLALTPWLAVLLNICENHEDFFGRGTSGFAQSFANYVRRNSNTLEYLVVAADDVPQPLLSLEVPGGVHSVGSQPSCHWVVSVVERSPHGSSFTVKYRRGDRNLGLFSIPHTGEHVIKAAAVAAVCATLCGASATAMARGLANSVLPDRRFSVLYESLRVCIVDDNARQPSQIRSLVSALRQRWPESILCIVASPWGRRNARDLFQWAPALAAADAVVILPVDDASVLRGGAERADAAEVLHSMVLALGSECWVAQNEADAVHAIRSVIRRDRHVVLVTAGYDSFQPAFAQIHSLIETEERPRSERSG